MNYLYLLIPVAIIFFAGIRIVKPNQRGIIERLGNYRNFANPGFHWIIPVIDRIYIVNLTEQMVDTESQEIITYDKFIANVKAHVYFRVKADEESVKGLIYNVRNYQWQIANLTRTTLRNIISTLMFNPANIESGNINTELYKTLYNETKSWGIEIVGTELKEMTHQKTFVNPILSA